MYAFKYYRYNTNVINSIPRDAMRCTPANPETCSCTTDPEILSQYEHRALAVYAPVKRSACSQLGALGFLHLGFLLGFFLPLIIRLIVVAAISIIQYNTTKCLSRTVRSLGFVCSSPILFVYHPFSVRLALNVAVQIIFVWLLSSSFDISFSFCPTLLSVHASSLPNYPKTART